MALHRFMFKPLFAGSVDHRVREGRLGGGFRAPLKLKGCLLGLL